MECHTLQFSNIISGSQQEYKKYTTGDTSQINRNAKIRFTRFIFEMLETRFKIFAFEAKIFSISCHTTQ